MLISEIFDLVGRQYCNNRWNMLVRAPRGYREKVLDGYRFRLDNSLLLYHRKPCTILHFRNEVWFFRNFVYFVDCRKHHHNNYNMYMMLIAIFDVFISIGIKFHQIERKSCLLFSLHRLNEREYFIRLLDITDHHCYLVIISYSQITRII